MDHLHTLRMMLADMAEAPVEFRPTRFWRRCLDIIVADLENLGFENFREHPSARSFYVPGYEHPRYVANRERVDRILTRLPDRRAATIRRLIDGTARARTDHRLVAATDRPGGLPLEGLRESRVGGGSRHRIGSEAVTRSWLNYLRALTLLKASVDTTDLRSILEIGGGYGTLGEILLASRPDDGFYVAVDIPPVATVAEFYLGSVIGRDAVAGYLTTRDLDVIDLDELRDRYRAVVLAPWQLPRLRGEVDLFANFMSFQEMEPAVVRNYVDLVDDHIARYVLLRNSATGKQVAPEGGLGVAEPVSMDDAIAAFADFDVAGRDSYVHGEQSPDGTFRSEVAVLTRRPPA